MLTISQDAPGRSSPPPHDQRPSLSCAHGPKDGAPLPSSFLKVVGACPGEPTACGTLPKITR